MLIFASGSKNAGSFPPSSIQVGTMISAAATATCSSDQPTAHQVCPLTLRPTGSLPMTIVSSSAAGNTEAHM